MNGPAQIDADGCCPASIATSRTRLAQLRGVETGRIAVTVAVIDLGGAAQRFGLGRDQFRNALVASVRAPPVQVRTPI